MTEKKRKVVFCIPFVDRPTEPLMAALEASIPVIVAAGWDEGLAQERGNPYISQARNAMLRKALDAKADVIVFLDYDLSFDSNALLKLIETEGDVVGGTYRFKKDEEAYMGEIFGVANKDGMGRPIVRPEDGAIKMALLPAGFLKITATAVDRIMRAHPELVFGPAFNPSLDIFNHGAHDGIWWGEDYAFCRRWTALGQDLWCVPDLNITHHSIGFNKKTWETEQKEYPGNYREFLLRAPGGSKSANPIPPA